MSIFKKENPLFNLFLAFSLWLILGSFILAVYFLAGTGGPKIKFPYILLSVFVFYVIGLVVVWLFKARVESWSAIGLTFFSPSAVGWGLLALVLFFLFTNIYAGILAFFGLDLNKAYNFTALFSQVKSWWLVPAYLIIGFFGPLVEEIFFRGYLYNTLKRELNKILAVVVSSVVFSLLHFSLLLFLPYFFFGVLSAWLLEKRGSLDASLLFHILNNIFALTVFVWLKNPGG